MYIYLYNLYRIHFYHTYAYVTLNDESTIYLNEVETFVINEIILENKYDYLICNLNSKLQINNIEDSKQLIEKILISLKAIVKKSDSLNNYPYKVKITGEYNKFYPEMIQISLTNCCGHKCIHCYKGEIQKSNFLNSEDINNLLGNIKGKVSTIQFTGGEPLLHKGIKEIINNFKDDFTFSITTSAFINLTDEMISILKEFDLVQVSLYGATSEQHDNFSATKGSFKVVIKNIKKMISEGIDVNISTIITPVNIINIEDLIKFCITMKVKSIMFGKIISIGRAIELDNILITNQHEKFIRKQLNIYRDKYLSQIEVFTWDEYKSESDNILGNWVFKCGAGRFKLSINDDGNIVPCYLVDSNIFSMGSLYNKDCIKIFTDYNYVKKFNDLWKNKIRLNNYNIDNICEKISLRGK